MDCLWQVQKDVLNPFAQLPLRWLLIWAVEFLWLFGIVSAPPAQRSVSLVQGSFPGVFVDGLSVWRSCVGKRDMDGLARRTPGCVEFGRDVDSVQRGKRSLCKIDTLFWFGFVFLADGESKSSFGQSFADTADKSPWQRKINGNGEKKWRVW